MTLNLGVIHRMQGHYQQALFYQEKALTLFRQIGAPYWEGVAMANHALLALHLGNYEQASSGFAQTNKLWEQAGTVHLQDGLYTFWGLLKHYLGHDENALVMVKQAKEINQSKGEVPYLALACLVSGHVKGALGLKKKAQNAYQEALRLWQANHKQKLSMEAKSGLAELALEQNKFSEALSYVEQIIRHRTQNPTLAGTYEPRRILLTCIKVLEAAGQTEQADALLEESYQLLMQRANDLKDEKLRESFLQNVSFHREIVWRWSNRARI